MIDYILPIISVVVVVCVQFYIFKSFAKVRRGVDEIGETLYADEVFERLSISDDNEDCEDNYTLLDLDDRTTLRLYVIVLKRILNERHIRDRMVDQHLRKADKAAALGSQMEALKYLDLAFQRASERMSDSDVARLRKIARRMRHAQGRESLLPEKVVELNEGFENRQRHGILATAVGITLLGVFLSLSTYRLKSHESDAKSAKEEIHVANIDHERVSTQLNNEISDLNKEVETKSTEVVRKTTELENLNTEISTRATKLDAALSELTAYSDREWRDRFEPILIEQFANLPGSPPPENWVPQATAIEANVPGNLAAISLQIGLDQVWRDYRLLGRGRAVAIVGGGNINTQHEDFRGDNGQRASNVFDDAGQRISLESTHLAGIIAANGINQGVAPAASIVAFNVCDTDGNVDAIRLGSVASRLATIGPDLAVGVVLVEDFEAKIGWDGQRQLLQGLREQLAPEVIIVTPAGTRVDSVETHEIDGVISVGAVFSDSGPPRRFGRFATLTVAPDVIAPYSRHGWIFAPGGPVASTGADATGQCVYEGTPVAAAVLAGTIALLQDVHLRSGQDLPSIDKVREWLKTGGAVIQDGDNEVDNVEDMPDDFVRLDALGAVAANQQELNSNVGRNSPTVVRESVTMRNFSNDIRLSKVRQDFIDTTNETAPRPFDGTGMTVAIVGTGIFAQHPDYADRVLAALDFTGTSPDDDIGVSTHVAGIVAGNNATKGIGTKTKLVSLKAFTDQDALPVNDSLIAAMTVLRERHREWNLSAVLLDFGEGNYRNAQDVDNPTVVAAINQTIDALVAERIAVFAPAGNSYQEDGNAGMAFPAIQPKVISVGAVNFLRDARNNTDRPSITEYSQRLLISDLEVKPIPHHTTLFAPGGPLLSSYHKPDAPQAKLQGTSMSAAVAVGVAVLLQDYWKTQTLELPEVDDLQHWLQNRQSLYRDETTGNQYHAVDAYDAFLACRESLIEHFSKEEANSVAIRPKSE